MAELTFKEISYIRSALKYRLQGLEREVDADNDDQLDESFTEDERIDLQEDIVFYDKLLYLFEKAEKQSQELKVVQSVSLPSRDGGK